MKFLLLLVTITCFASSTPTRAEGLGLEALAAKIRQNRLRSDALSAFPSREVGKVLQELLTTPSSLHDPKTQENSIHSPSKFVGQMACLRLVGGKWEAAHQTTCLAIKSNSEACFVITSAHLVPDEIDVHGHLIGVVNPEGRVGLARSCLALDRNADFAIFKIDPIFSHAAKLSQETPKIGTPILTTGFHPKIGLIQLHGRTINQVQSAFVFSDVRVVGGMSGSPCFTSDGRAIGLVREIVPNFRSIDESGSDLFSEATFTKIRLFEPSRDSVPAKRSQAPK